MSKQRSPKREELVRTNIKDLFEAYGYEEYKMRMFEKYSLYLEHKDFLVGDKAITFTDISGELLALRPDVTLSIVKNCKAAAGVSEKLYYCENVYREDKQNGRFREINQLGLELIGSIGQVELAETISLALGALSLISGDFVLELSHIDFVSALFSACGLSALAAAAAKNALRAGSVSELRRIAAYENLSSELTEKLCGLIAPPLSFKNAIEKAETLIADDEMRRAHGEIVRLYEALKGEPYADKLRLDFSLTGEENYYNGFVMSGFVQGVPKAVLSGGQYDKLLKKMDKNAQAIGFAVYLGELAAYFGDVPPPCDILLVYGDAPADKVLAEARKLRGQGYSVRTEKTADGVPGIKTVILGGGK